MTVIGRVESVWRYPVKSMRGEELEEAFVGFSGIYGDRIFAFRSSTAIRGFPYLTAREQAAMLLCRPVFRHREQMSAPPNLADATALGSGVTPLFAPPHEQIVDVYTRGGDVFAVDDPRLIEYLRDGAGERHELTLLQSDRAMTDCRPVSLISIQTVRQLGDEVGTVLDKRLFRASIYADLNDAAGFAEDALVGRQVLIGPKVRAAFVCRDSRCNDHARSRNGSA